MKEIRTLTGLRGWAALWVFFYHSTYAWAGSSIWLEIARAGSDGVPIFFVLSGFILAYVYAPQLEAGALTYRKFLGVRIARIYPLHIVVLIGFVFFSKVGMLSLGPDDNSWTLCLNALLLQSWGFVDHLTWNEPAWSISVEMFAYLIFPLILAYLTQARLFLFVLFAAGLWLWIHTCSYLPAITFLAAHGLILPTPAAPAMHFAEGLVLLRYVPIFVAGVVLFCSIRNRDLPRWVGDLFLISGIALIIYISLTHDGWIEPITGAAILIVTGLFRSGAIGYFLFANSVSVTLGEVSYALYLSHDGLKYILAKTFGFRLQLLPLLLATLLVATILHFGVERPARALLRRRLKSFPPKVTSLESVVSGE